jgi:hypothetical protein
VEQLDLIDTADRIRERLDQLLTEHNPLERVWLADRLAGDAADLRRAEIAAARDTGQSWTSIGDVLGTTKQAAQQRFGS